MTRRPYLLRAPVLLLALLAPALALAAPPSVPAETPEQELALDTSREPLAALDFIARTESGHSIRLSDLRGRVVLLNFWATWCTPCLSEMPSLDRLNRRLKGRPFTLLAVNVEQPAEIVHRFAEKHRLGFDLLLDPEGKISEDYLVHNLPLTYIIDRQGKVLYRAIGARDWDRPSAMALLTALMAAPPSPAPPAPTVQPTAARAR